MTEFNADQEFAGTMEMIRGAIGTVQAAQLGLEGYEYKMVPFDELTAYGADRWRVVPIPPMQEIRMILGQATPGLLTFLMERQVIVGDFPDGA